MQRLFRHIVLMSLALLWVVRAGATEAPGTLPSGDRVATTQQQVGQLDKQDDDLHRLILQSLSGDNAPFSYAQNTARTLTPVTRLNPYHKFTAGMLSRLAEPAPPYVQLGTVQQRSVARLRAALDERGYYVFALRKIII